MEKDKKLDPERNFEIEGHNEKTYLETVTKSLVRNGTQRNDVTNLNFSILDEIKDRFEIRDTVHNGAIVKVTKKISEIEDCNYNLNGDYTYESTISNSDSATNTCAESPISVSQDDDECLKKENQISKYSSSLSHDCTDITNDNNRDLKDFYKQCKAERLQEQEMAEEEKHRLEQILRICSEFEVQSADNALVTRSESRNSLGKIKTNGSLTKLVLSSNEASSQNQIEHRFTPSSSSNSDDDLEKGTIKRRPSGLSLSPVLTVVPNKTKAISPVNTEMSPISRSFHERSSVGVSQSNQYMDHNLKRVPDVLLDSNWSALEDKLKMEKFSNSFRKDTNSLLNHSRSKTKGSTPNFSSICYSVDPTKHRKFDVSKQWNQMQSFEADRDLDNLKLQQCNVLDTIADIKQRIVSIECRQSEALRELEMERALLEGEQHIQIEQLRLAEEKINQMERRETQLLFEAANQRAEDLELIDKERERLSEMRHQHKESRQESSASNAEQAGVNDEQDAIDNQRYLVDNLEFQQLETESRYEEEKEIIQKELKVERDDLLNMCLQHQTTLDQIASQQSDLLQQVDIEVYQLENDRQLLVEQLKTENARLLKLNNKSRELSLRLMTNQDVPLNDSNGLALLESINNLELTSRDLSKTVSRLDSRHQSLHNIEMWDGVYEMNDNERQRMNEIRLRATLPPRSPWDSRRQRSEGRDVRGDGSYSRNDSWSQFKSESEDESSASGSERLSDNFTWKDDDLDKLADMECLLVLKNAEKLRLKEEKDNWCAATTTGCPERRADDKRFNDFDVIGPADVAEPLDSSVQNIKRREKEKLQSRPLTRYLPVRDQSLDLVQFIMSSGHSVQHCSHLIMSSTSCRGYLIKMGSRLRSWKKRWFVFDRSRRSLSYYADKSESKARGVVYFQAIEDVFVDHLHQVKSPTPQLTFCVKTFERVYYLVAPSPDSMRIWIDVLFTGAEGYHQFA